MEKKNYTGLTGIVIIISVIDGLGSLVGDPLFLQHSTWNESSPHLLVPFLASLPPKYILFIDQTLCRNDRYFFII